jgi:hypothetical protein
MLVDVEDTTMYRQFTHRWRLGCQPYATAALYSPERSSGTHLCQSLSKTQALLRLEGIIQLKKIQLPHLVSNPGPSA